MSVWQTPHACTRTSASPGPGSGTSMVTISTGCFTARATTALTCCDMHAPPALDGTGRTMAHRPASARTGAVDQQRAAFALDELERVGLGPAVEAEPDHDGAGPLVDLGLALDGDLVEAAPEVHVPVEGLRLLEAVRRHGVGRLEVA